MIKFNESRYIVKARVSEEWNKKFKEENSVNWVEGYLLIANNKKDYFKYRVQPIADSERHAFPVDPKTICMPTGQKDKNNVHIFEHDLCKLNNEYVDEDELFEVLWDEENARYILKGEHTQYNFVTSYGSDFEVIGNVFDKQKIQKDAKRTLFVGDKSKEEIADMIYGPLTDGIDHLNIFSNAKTELGRFMSNFAKCPIETEDGPFMSIEGYWGWLSISEDNPKRDVFRTLYGVNAKKAKDNLIKNGDPGRKDDDFDLKIDKAIHQKFTSQKGIDMLTKNKELLKLPIRHYYYYGKEDNCKIIDVTEDYPEFINAVKTEIDNFLQRSTKSPSL